MQTYTMRRVGGVALVLLMLGSGVWAGAQMTRDDRLFELRKNFQIFGAIYEHLVTDYVEPLDPGRLMRVGVRAMLQELDPYTTFIDASERARIGLITRGQYGGVGVRARTIEGQPAIVEVVPGSPADVAGMHVGDRVTHVNGIPVRALSADGVDCLLCGTPGSTVTVTVHRAGRPAPLQLTLTRENVQLQDVTFAGFLRPGIGYIKLERFTRGAGAATRAAIRDLQAEGTVQRLILDLRGNPGGLLGAAVDVAELFLASGSVVVSTRGRGTSPRTYHTDRAPLLPRAALVLLVDGETASASEIVAGALQDHDRAAVLGTRTFGKGLVQVVRSLPHNTALKMTTARYYTPSGRSIQDVAIGALADDSLASADTFRTDSGRRVRDHRGIEPDVRVAPAVPAVIETLHARGAFFRFANRFVAAHPALPVSFAVRDDSTWQAFRTWVLDHEIGQQTAVQQRLDSLATEAQRAGYASALDEVEMLEAALARAFAQQLDAAAPQVRQRLTYAIQARTLTRRAQIRAHLYSDPLIERAFQLFQRPEDLTNILRQK